MVAKIREHGHRITPQRRAVARVLASSHDHPSAEQMYDRVRAEFPMTSLATVYKTVNLLKQMGQVLEVGFSDDRRHYDGCKPFPHPHLICVQCKHIMDADIDDLDRLIRRVGRKTGFKVHTHLLEFYGVCPRCQAMGAH